MTEYFYYQMDLEAIGVEKPIGGPRTIHICSPDGRTKVGRTNIEVEDMEIVRFSKEQNCKGYLKTTAALYNAQEKQKRGVVETSERLEKGRREAKARAVELEAAAAKKAAKGA